LLEDREARRPCFDQTGENLEIDVHEVVDAGLPHLEHHLPTIRQPRGVHLSDGSAPEGFGIEEREDLVGRCAQVFSNDLRNGLHRQWGDFILQLRELGTIRLRQ